MNLTEFAYYYGMGELYRMFSLIIFIDKLKKKFGVKTIAEYPEEEVSRDFPKLLWKQLSNPHGEYDLVFTWNFRDETLKLIDQLKALSKKYVLLFGINKLNFGFLIHSFYHWRTKTPCNHPEDIKGKFNNPESLKKALEEKGVRVIETGFIDKPPWFDTIIGVKSILVGKEEEKPLEERYVKIPNAVGICKRLLSLERILPGKVFGHHSYALGVKR